MRKRILRAALLFILYALFLSAFISCDQMGQTNNEDDSPENKEPLDTAIYLPITADGNSVITVVSSYSKDPEYAKAFKEFSAVFKDAGIEMNYTFSVSDDPLLPELIIGGGVGATGELYIDPHDLGDEGYAIRVIGEKIVVAGGSTDSLVKAIKLFCNDILKLGDHDTDKNNLCIPRATDIYERQYYPVSSVKIDGNDLSGYDIVCDVFQDEIKTCANKLQTVLYGNAGYWLDIKSRSSSPSIRISIVSDSGDGGFRIYVDGSDLIIECAYLNMLEYACDTFISDYLASPKPRSVSFDADFTYKLKVDSISYADFGAVGDGVTDDFYAIKAAHDVANRTGQKVVADKGKTYNLGQHSESIIIKTDTVWTDATFIIDDSGISPADIARRYDVFRIASDTVQYQVTDIPSLKKGQTNVGLTFDGPTVLHLLCKDIMQYVRYGANADSGSYQQEIILVDEYGNVDPSTPILWDYPTLSVIKAFSASDRPITVEGGSFITVANAAPREYVSYSRGIAINRSNVTIKDVIHTVTGETDTGAPYNGFINISSCNNVLVQNVTFTGHKVYAPENDPSNRMGTYDMSVTLANNVTFRDCRQTNSITDATYWGVMGSNYCKNLTYDGCVLSRFDAHKGTHNATIINSEIGHQGVRIIGSGTLRVENTVIHGNNAVHLRNDYGSTWDGDIIFKNITLNNTSSKPVLVHATWYNHDFGYTCHLPENIYIDGITLAKGDTFYVLAALKNDIDKDTVLGENNLNPIVLTKKITVVNVNEKYTYYVSSNMQLFADVLLVEAE